MVDKILLFYRKHESLEVFPFGMIDANGVVGRLGELMEYAHVASALGRCCEHCQAELLPRDSLGA